MGGVPAGVAVPEVSSEKEGEEAKGSGSGNSLMARKDTVQKILLESRAKPRVGVAKDGPEEWAILRGENRGRVCAYPRILVQHGGRSFARSEHRHYAELRRDIFLRTLCM